MSSAMGHRLKELRKLKSWTQQDAAEAFGMSKGGYVKIEDGDRGLSLEHVRKACEIYGVGPTEVMGDPAYVPLVGYVGAGSEAHFYDGGDPPDELVQMPAGGNDLTVAVLVRGDSLGAFFNGWLVYYDDRREPFTSDLLRKLCVVGLADGRVLIKKVMPGSAAGHFHLVSQTEGIIEDAVITWAAEVKAMTPR